MILRIFSYAVGLLVILFAGLAVNGLRIGPPALPPAPPVDDIVIDRSGAAERLAAAIRFQTVSRGVEAPVANEALLGLHEYLADTFPMVHATLKREVVNGFSLLYTWEGGDRSQKPILLSAHQDVVPVEPGTEVDWTHAPFDGAIADGFVWGRGTMDMKSSMMGILEAVEYLLAQNIAPRRTVYLAFGHDEEIGGNGGAGKIADILRSRKVKLAFSLDEGLVVTDGILPDVPKPVAVIGIAEKGLVTLRLSARGPGGHGSMPPSNSAVGRLARALTRMEAHPMEADLRPPVIDMFRAVISEMSWTTRLIFGNRWLFKPIILTRLSRQPATGALVRSTLAVTIVKAGVKPNVIPQEAEAIINVRLLPGDTVSSVIQHLSRVIDDPNVGISIAPGTQLEASPISDTTSNGYQQLVRTIRQVFPDALVAPGLLIGTTDTRHYLELTENSFRFLPLRIKPNDLSRFHGTDERIAINNYVEIIRFYVQFLKNTATTTNS